MPETLGNGQDPKNNLYWGAAYGIKSYFRYKSPEWEYIKSWNPINPNILERSLFKHKTKNAMLIADAYNGAQIQKCTEDFLLASNGQNPDIIELNDTTMLFGGNADLVSYIGHDGLMEFSVYPEFKNTNETKDAIILACYSKDFFQEHIKAANANPLVWSTHLMAPEAYTLKAAIDGWLLNETNLQIEERASQAYNKYQKCGIKGARNLLTTGF